MQVTSDTLFHFTTSLKNLINILLKKFQLTYCEEIITLNIKTEKHYFPMISFCDIPLSLAKKHIDKYGSYAIGMTKEWGIKNKLNPVVYFEKDSLISKDIQDTLDSMLNWPKIITDILKNVPDIFKKLKPEKIEEFEFFLKYFTNYQQLIKNFKKIGSSSNNLFRYIKNYQGTLVRQVKKPKNYRFYDEREWRYVPSISDKRVEWSLNEEQYKKYRGNGYAKPLIDKITLKFTSDDIKYLIVKSSEDIPKLIKSVKSINNLTKNSNEADILTTKILTVEQLNNDF